MWSTNHFFTTERIASWLQGTAVSPRLTQTVNPHLWLAVMMPCKVSPAVTNEVSLGQTHQAETDKPKMLHIRLKISLFLTAELIHFV